MQGKLCTNLLLKMCHQKMLLSHGLGCMPHHSFRKDSTQPLLRMCTWSLVKHSNHLFSNNNVHATSQSHLIKSSSSHCKKSKDKGKGKGKKKLKGKNVVYVGGFGGIGFQTCKGLVQKKIAKLVVVDRAENASLLEELQCYGSESGTKVSFEQLDLTKKDDIKCVVKKVNKEIGTMDILVNGSGMINDHKPVQTMEVNLMGLIYTTMEAIPLMDKKNGGRGGMIVNIASVLGLEPCACLAIYTGSKHGVMGFSRSIADDFYYKRTGIAVITICPGITMTNLWHEFEGNDTFPYSAELSKKFFCSKSQKPEECAVNFVKAMESFKNGSIWILDLGKLEEVKPKNYWNPIDND